jgi:antitoxin ParD1/3/4
MTKHTPPSGTDSAAESFNIAMPRELSEFVEKRWPGQFGNRSEYFRHLVREDQKNSARSALDKLLWQGIHSGPGIPAEEVFAELRQRLKLTGD